jgi:ribosome-binding ATPase YchF (GTP1/OBG family)
VLQRPFVIRLSPNRLSAGQARNRGWLRDEGKEYVVAEGHVMEFLFNV